MSRRPFATTYLDCDAVWEPLEAIARITRLNPKLPQVYEDEFTYMNAVENRRKGTRIHLYEHIDTWRQLNLDDAGHAYEYCFLPGSAARDRDPHFGGHYRPHRSLAAALHHLDLDLVGLWRRVPHTR